MSTVATTPRVAARLGARAARRWHDAVRVRPVHAALGSLLLGLLAAPRARGAVLGCALLAAAAMRPAPRALACAALVLAGAWIALARLDALERTRLGPLIDHAFAGRVTLSESPRPSPFGGASALAALRGEPVLVRSAGRLPWPSGVHQGAILDVRGVLLVPDRYAALRHAHAVLRAVAVAASGARRGGLGGFVDGVRDRARTALGGGLPAEQAGLYRGMVLGDDSELTPGVRADFRATGLTHHVAASGENVALLFALVAAAGAALGAGQRARLGLAGGLVALYVPLAGGGPSIERAGVMGAAALAAQWVGRPFDRVYALLLAAVVTLALDPRAAGDAGWQMSFAAVGAILLLAPPWSERLRRRGLADPLADAVAITAAATMATAPIIAAHFQQASLVSIPANLLAVVAVAPIMWLGILAGAAGQVAPVLALPFNALAALPVGYLTAIAHTAARAPAANIRAGPWPVAIACAVVTAMVSSRRVRRASGPVALAGLALLACVIAAGG